jgi:hypothetical protein
MARAALGHGGLWVHEHRGAVGSGLIRARLREALARTDPGDSLALRLRARMAAEADYASGGQAAILAVLDEARASPVTVARTEALRLAHHCLLGPEHGAARRRLAEELIGEAAHADRRADLLMGLLWQVVDLYLAGDPHAPRRLSELRALLAEGPHLAVGYVVATIDAMLAIRAGRLWEAERLAEECREQGARAGDADADAWYGAQLVAIRWHQGRLAELLPTLTEFVGMPTLSEVDNAFVAAVAVAAAQAGDRQGAAGALARLRGRSLADLPRSSSWLVALYGAVEAAYLLGDADAAADAYEQLLPFADLPMMVSLAVACFGSVQHALGVASLTTGELDRAVCHLRGAVQHNKALAHWPAVVASRMRLAEALLRGGDPEYESEARAHRAGAEAMAARLALPVPVVDATPLTGQAARCRREGRGWRIDVGTRSVRVGHSVGMLHLAVLVANPGVDIAAISLVAGVAAAAGPTVHEGLSAQPVLDRAAVQRYRRRLAQLQDEMADLESGGDRAEAARARAERAWLLGELAGGAGPGGRSRAFVDNKERARLAVGRAIRRAFDRIERADAVVGAHLRASVHTGAYCWYRPG